METYDLKISGVKPLLLHNPEGQIGDKPQRRRGEHLDSWTEAERSLYKSDSGEVCVPAYNIKACIREAGRNYQISGRKTSFAAMIRAGISIDPEKVPIESNDGWKPDVRPVVIQRQRILRSRPRFDDWSLSFTIHNLDPAIIHSDTLERILGDAGRYYGLGDFRPEFGLFRVESFDLG